MDFILSEIDGKKIEKDLWKEFHIYRKEYHQAVRPNDPLESDEFAEKSFLLQVANPEWEAFPFVIRKGQEGGPIIGLFFYVYFTEASPSYENMKPMMLGHIELLPQYRKKGIGKKLLKIVYEKSSELNKSVIMGNSEELDGRAFVNSFGGKEGVVQFENRLTLADMDWSMVNGWFEKGKKRSPTSVLKYFKTVPEELIDNFAEVFTETLNQIPKGDIDMGDNIQTSETIRRAEHERNELGKERINVITIEPNGEISGMTWLTYNSDKPEIMEQGLTSVREKYRGRGLGKLIKAAALLKAKETYPKVEIIATLNQTTNAPMLAINDELGFKKFKEMVTVQLSVESLATIFAEETQIQN